MDPGYDVWRTAGYRDVVVNVQVVPPLAVRLGCHAHICEIQLILASIFSLKVPPSLCVEQSMISKQSKAAYTEFFPPSPRALAIFFPP